MMVSKSRLSGMRDVVLIYPTNEILSGLWFIEITFIVVIHQYVGLVFKCKSEKISAIWNTSIYFDTKLYIVPIPARKVFFVTRKPAH